MLQAFNATARYVDQGGGKRNGSFAIYLEPWHRDIRAFLDMRKITVMKMREQGIYFMHYGFRIYLWRE